MNEEMTDEEKKQRWNAYTDYVNESNKRQLSSAENFDKSILTYSSGGLAISLTILKDFIPISQAVWPCLLYSSWLLFVTAIMLTVISFSLSYKANGKSQKYCYKYMMENNHKYFNKKSIYDKFLAYVNFISGFSFITAIIFTSLFVAINLKGAEMSEKKIGPVTYTEDGMPAALMKPVPPVAKPVTNPVPPTVNNSPTPTK